MGNIAQSYANAALERQPRLVSAADDRLAQGREALRACQQRLRYAQTYANRCQQQIVNMEDYLRSAIVREEDEDRIAYYGKLLARDRDTLNKANDEVLTLTTALSEIEDEVERLSLAAEVLIEEMN